jgi:outer membrane protein assembly factor BamD (BamD/ComL family)
VAVKDEDRLARQNELYQQAVALQRAGDVPGAVKKLEAVLVDHRSPLAETALAQKMKWLSATDRAAAREVARDYLQRFPMGFGRADAETLVLEPK